MNHFIVVMLNHLKGILSFASLSRYMQNYNTILLLHFELAPELKWYKTNAPRSSGGLGTENWKYTMRFQTISAFCAHNQCHYPKERKKQNPEPCHSVWILQLGCRTVTALLGVPLCFDEVKLKRALLFPLLSLIGVISHSLRSGQGHCWFRRGAGRLFRNNWH